MEKRAFSIIFDEKSIEIDTDKFYTHEHPDSFMYSNMKDCYTTGNGHGLQNNDPTNYNALMKLCDTISVAIYKYLEAINYDIN